MDAQELALRNFGRFAPAACTETHAGVVAMLWKIVNKHADRYGGDRDELFAEAGYGFMRAYSSYDPAKKASFSTWCWWWVWGRLMDQMKKSVRRKAVDNCMSLDADDDRNLHDAIPAEPAGVDPDVVAGRLTSDDAKSVLRMVLDCPAELASTMRGTTDARGIRSALRGYLAGLGWTASRIVDSLNEIRGVL